MGLFDKIKAAKNAITGGAAKVYISSTPVSLEDPFVVTVKAIIGDADVKADRVYLYVKSLEEISIEGYNIDIDDAADDVLHDEETLRIEMDVTGAQVLSANETYEWEAEVTLPSHAKPQYRGTNCKHVYYAYAGIDALGNDPDSGWVEIH